VSIRVVNISAINLFSLMLVETGNLKLVSEKSGVENAVTSYFDKYLDIVYFSANLLLVKHVLRTSYQRRT